MILQETSGRRLAGDVVIVTGAADGIGRAIAVLFARQGAAVCVADVNETLGAEVLSAIEEEGGRAIFVRTNVTEEESIREMVGQTVAAFGPPSVLVNNAGIIVVNKDPVATDDATWDRLFGINVEGMWKCCQAVLPHMIAERRGSIVNLGSVHSFRIVPGHFPYAVTKHAVVGLTRSLAVEYGPLNIRVNALCPGMVETPTAFRVWSELPDPDAVRKAVGDIHPLRRNASPEEMAYPALFLACQESSFMTGQTLTVDGGRSAFYSD